MSAKPFLWLACGLALAGCAGEQSIPSRQARTQQGLEVIPQAEQAQQNQQRRQNLINEVRAANAQSPSI